MDADATPLRAPLIPAKGLENLFGVIGGAREGLQSISNGNLFKLQGMAETLQDSLQRNEKDGALHEVLEGGTSGSVGEGGGGSGGSGNSLQISIKPPLQVSAPEVPVCVCVCIQCCVCVRVID